MISGQTTQEVRARSSIVEVVSDYVTLRKTGHNYSGLCPFHSEKTPSFTVNEEKGVFYCFGCQAGGDVFKFLMLYDGLTFPESVQRLAERYGIRVESSEPGRARRDARRGDLFRLNEQAAEFFQAQLQDPSQGARARAYLEKRGVDESLWRLFRLGFAPRGDALAGRFRTALGDAAEAGLVVERERGRYRDRFFDRIIFPIMDPGGRVLGFGGRVIADGTPKYLNSPETPLFHKGSQVYGLGQAREGVRAMDRVVVVEGYLDVLALAQSGVPHAVATLGTALTADHLRLLARYTKNVTALFDGDDAGRNAAARSFEAFQQAGVWGQAAFLPQGEDPDTFVRSRGKAALDRVLAEALPVVDYYLNWLRDGYGAGLGGKSRLANEVARMLAKVTNPFDRELLARRSADLLGIREETLRRHAGDDRGAAPRTSTSGVKVGGGDRERWSPGEDLAESSLVALMLRFPSVAATLRGQPMERLVTDKWREVIRRLLAGPDTGVEVGALTEDLPAELASEVAGLALRGQEIGEEQRDRMTSDCVFFLQRRYLRSLERELCRAIRVAEESSDDEAKKERMRQWQDVVQKERRLERMRAS